MNIFRNKKEWKSLPDAELEQYATDIFNYYRENGFPYFPSDDEFRQNEFRKLNDYDFSRVLDVDERVIKQSMHGLSLAWSYMPHSWDVECGDKRSVMDTFNDDELFMKVIRKRLRFGDNISDNGIRKMMKIFSGTQAVSNFRPTAAAAIYSHFANKGDTVWDMSSGFGGRILGAILAEVNYIGTDPSTKSFNGVNGLADRFANNITTELHCVGSEDYHPEPESLDLCFTSPPYFDTERYSLEDTQSYKRYPTKKAWLDGYLEQTFTNCFSGLKSGKYMLINIADVPSFPNLEKFTVLVAERVGFVQEDTWKLALSNVAANKSSSYKYEPIFVFKKP